MQFGKKSVKNWIGIKMVKLFKKCLLDADYLDSLSITDLFLNMLRWHKAFMSRSPFSMRVCFHFELKLRNCSKTKRTVPPRVWNEEKDRSVGSKNVSFCLVFKKRHKIKIIYFKRSWKISWSRKLALFDFSWHSKTLFYPYIKGENNMSTFRRQYFNDTCSVFLALYFCSNHSKQILHK